MKASLYLGTAFTAVVMAAAYAFVSPGTALAADGAPLLTGKVVSSTGEALAGIPIKAHRDNSAVTVAVYTDAKGEYSFPAWSDLTPGSYSVGVELPDFERTAQPVAVSEGKAAKIDFTLKSKPLAYEDATASEIIAGLPGTDHQKTLFSQCSNCHTLQWALQAGRTKEEWVAVVKKMAGRAAEQRDARDLCVRPEAVHRAFGRISDLDPRTRVPPTTSRSSNARGRPMRPPPISS